MNRPEMPDLSTPAKRLAHVIEMFYDVNPDDFAIVATSHYYSQGQVTGLTWADLRALLLEVQS